MSYYSLLPGTNQLIEKNGNQGTSLFRRHGYNIRNPNYYHYYNALRGPQGPSFFDDLAGILGGVAKVWGAAAGQPNAATYTRQAQLAPAMDPTSASLPSLSNANPFANQTIPAMSDIGSFTGNNQSQGNSRGVDPGRQAAFLELLHHFRNESIRRGYIRDEQMINTFYQPIPQVYSVGLQFQAPGQSQQGNDPANYQQPVDNGSTGYGIGDTIHSIRTPLFIIGGVILLLIIWHKIR